MLCVLFGVGGVSGIERYVALRGCEDCSHLLHMYLVVIVLARHSIRWVSSSAIFSKSERGSSCCPVHM
jgi:hypothetical protein